MTKDIVYDSLIQWNIGRYDPRASVTYSVTPPYTVSFTNSSQYAENYYWDFGDGTTSTDMNPVHTYVDSGTYIVTLIPSRCSYADLLFITVSTTALIGVPEIEGRSEWTVFPNPMSERGILMCQRPIGSYRVLWIDAMGRKVREEPGAEGEVRTIDSEGLDAGVYRLVIIEEGQKVVVLKMMITK